MSQTTRNLLTGDGGFLLGGWNRGSIWTFERGELLVGLGSGSESMRLSATREQKRSWCFCEKVRNMALFSQNSTTIAHSKSWPLTIHQHQLKLFELWTKNSSTTKTAFRFFFFLKHLFGYCTLYFLEVTPAISSNNPHFLHGCGSKAPGNPPERLSTGVLLRWFGRLARGVKRRYGVWFKQRLTLTRTETNKNHLYRSAACGTIRSYEPISRFSWRCGCQAQKRSEK